MCKMKDWCQFLKKYKFDNLATYISLFSLSDLISFCFVHRIHRGRDPSQVRQGWHGAAPWGVVRLPAGVSLLGRQLGPPRALGILKGQNYISVKSQDSRLTLDTTNLIIVFYLPFLSLTLPTSRSWLVCRRCGGSPVTVTYNYRTACWTATGLLSTLGPLVSHIGRIFVNIWLFLCLLFLLWYWFSVFVSQTVSGSDLLEVTPPYLHSLIRARGV